MSRTFRATTSSYYNSKPVADHNKRQNVQPDTEHYRKRWWHGYDGGRSGAISPVSRAGDSVRYGYGDRGCGRVAKRYEKRRAAKVTRQVARHALYQMTEL